jgi:NADH dehydrogenase
MKQRPHIHRKRRIVIIGGGFAGAYCAQQLERALDTRDVEIVVLDRNNYFAFYPLLVEAGTGNLHPRHAVIAIRAFLRNAEFRKAEVVGLDPAGQRVFYRVPGSEETRSLAFDHLVVALGSVTRTPPVPGLAENGYGLKSLGDAVALRDRAIQMLELADATDDPALRRALLHFVVIGANFTGVEVAGEFYVFLREASRQYRRIDPDECQVTLVEIADRILPALDVDLSEYARMKMERRGIRVLTGTSATAIRPDRVELDNGESLNANTAIWCAGIAPPPVLATLNLPVDDRGYLDCTDDLRVRGHQAVWAIGDCAVNRGPDGQPHPATAQHAVRQGKHLAGNLAAALGGKPTTPFIYSSMGSLAALGCRTGVAKILGIKLSGFAAWFLWRTVYLMKMPGWSRRLRVAIDWTLDLLTRREFVELGVHRSSLEARTAGNHRIPPRPREWTPEPERT